MHFERVRDKLGNFFEVAEPNTYTSVRIWHCTYRTLTPLAPLASLPVLEEVRLFGICPPDRPVDDLLRSQSLRRAWITKYPQNEIQRLMTALAERSERT